jgi:DNA-binding response OmpR family regulator
MRVLLVSADPTTRETLALTARCAGRSGSELEILEASDGLAGRELAWKHRPQVVVADEITSRMGAFALARDLKGADPAFPGRVVILLDRSQDQWLAAWSGADAWFVKPVNPFELAETLTGFLGAPEKEAV